MYEEISEEKAEREQAVFPWWTARFGIVSWWDMEQFSARSFYQMGKLLEKVCAEHQQYRPAGDTDFAGSGANKRLSPERAEGLRQFMHEVGTHCGALGLSMCGKQIDYMIFNAHIFTNAQAADQLVNLDRMIRWEMESHEFFFLSPTNAAELYRQDEPLFGKEVEANFPSANFDISEAGKCLALSRSTACVMHLGRVVEVGLRVLTNTLGLPDRPDWGRHLTDIEKELTALYKTAGARSPDELFYSEAAAQIGHIKNAWRNPAMHADRTYTEDSARGILQAVKSLMQHLATKLHE